MIFTVISILLFIYIVFKRADLFAAIARFLYGIGRSEKAIKIFNIASKIGNLSFENKNLRAYLMLKEGDIDEAYKLFNLMLMEYKDPHKKLVIKSSYALVLWKQNKVSEAIEMLEDVHEKVKSTATYGSLGYMYAYNGNLQKALEYNLEALEYNDSNAIIIDNVAFTYQKMCDTEKATEYYKKLFELNPTFPEGYYHYAKILVNNGEKDEAIKNLKIALDKSFSFLSMISRRDILDFIDDIENNNL